MPFNLSQILPSFFNKTIEQPIENPMTYGGNPRESLLNNGDSKKNYGYGSTVANSKKTDMSSDTKVSFVSLAEETAIRIRGKS
jgi:hypothetical protein